VRLVLARLALCILVCLTPLGLSSQPAHQPVTFTADVAPIIAAHCSSCHRPSGVGPFSLLTYADVRQRSTLIAQVVERRIMPPWKPLQPKGTFLDDRSLTADEIALLRQWVADGSIEGARARTERPAAEDSASAERWNLGPPDLIVRMEEPYEVPASGTDVFRSFVIPIRTSAPRFVRAVEFHPGNLRAVHHANIGIDLTGASRRRDTREDGPGYAGGLLPDAAYPAGFLLGWAPGETPRASPEGTAWRLTPGSDLVLGMHLQTTGKPELVQASVGIYFTDQPPTRTPVGLRLGSRAIDIPAGDDHYVVNDRYVLPVDVELVGLRPHAHFLATRMDVRAELPDGTARDLLTIQAWDFRWQEVYRYARPLVLPRGTALTMRYTYDNSAANPRNPFSPPARIAWGQNSQNEMGDLWMQVIPVNSGDAPALAADIGTKMTASDTALLEKLVQAEPDDVSLHEELASLLLRSRRTADAIRQLREAVRAEPRSAFAHYNLGLTLLADRQLREAVTEFREALTLEPELGEASNNLGNALYQLGQVDDAVNAFERAVQTRPDNAEAHSNLALTLADRLRTKEAVDSYERALTLKPDLLPALMGLAWIRATASDPLLRNPSEALRLGTHAVQLTENRNVQALDVLGGALAAAGRFSEAAATARQAAALAAALGNAAAAEEIRRRQQLYEQGVPYRTP